MTGTTENNISEKVYDFMAERELQRLGIDEVRIVNRNGRVIEKMDELGAAHPEAEPDKLERLAVNDCLFDLEVEFMRVKLYAESIEQYVDSYVEELGVNVPPEVAHAQISLWHLADDCRRFMEEYESVRAWAGTFIERPAV